MTEKILQLNTQKNIFWTLVGILFLCAGLYMYYVTSTIHHVVSRQNLEAKASQLTLKLGSEEFQYVSLRNGITLARATSLGFTETSPATYISRDTLPQVSYLSKK